MKFSLKVFLLTVGFSSIAYQIYKYFVKGIDTFFCYSNNQSVFFNLGYFLGVNCFLIVGVLTILIAYKKLFIKSQSF